MGVGVLAFSHIFGTMLRCSDLVPEEHVLGNTMTTEAWSDSTGGNSILSCLTYLNSSS